MNVSHSLFLLVIAILLQTRCFLDRSEAYARELPLGYVEKENKLVCDTSNVALKVINAIEKADEHDLHEREREAVPVGVERLDRVEQVNSSLKITVGSGRLLNY